MQFPALHRRSHPTFISHSFFSLFLTRKVQIFLPTVCSKFQQKDGSNSCLNFGLGSHSHLGDGEQAKLPDHPGRAPELLAEAVAADGDLLEQRRRHVLRDEAGAELDHPPLQVRGHAGDGDPDEELLGHDPREVGDGAVGDGAADGLVEVDVVVAEPDVAAAGELDVEVAGGVVEGVGVDGVREEALGEAVLQEDVVRHAVQHGAAAVAAGGV